jgi:hypothetical protein
MNKLVDFSDRLTLVGDKSAKRVHNQLNEAVQNARDDQGDSMRGFALITWDNRGGCHTAISTESGPVDVCLVPVYVHDALNRHVAIVINQSSSCEDINGDDPPSDIG